MIADFEHPEIAGPRANGGEIERVLNGELRRLIHDGHRNLHRGGNSHGALDGIGKLVRGDPEIGRRLVDDDGNFALRRPRLGQAPVHGRHADEIFQRLIGLAVNAQGNLRFAFPAHFNIQLHRLRRRRAHDGGRLARGMDRDTQAKTDYQKEAGEVQGHGGDKVAVNPPSRPKLFATAFKEAVIYVIAAARQAPYETATFSDA